jgi:hypothetical protein
MFLQFRRTDKQTMTTAIDRAAKAICKEYGFPDKPYLCRQHARAALATTREPTPEMHLAAKTKREADKAKGLPTAWGDIWRTMHDAMMGEES